MKKYRIKVFILGTLPFPYDRKSIQDWKSDIFDVTNEIRVQPITEKSDGDEHEFSDIILRKMIPEAKDCDFQIYVTNIPLEGHYFTRRINSKTAVLSYSEFIELLNINSIPVENLTLRLLYAFTIIFKRYNDRFPLSDELTDFTHSDTRNCLFDFNGLRDDIIYSTVKPKLCDECFSNYVERGYPVEKLRLLRKELKKVDKSIYFRTKDFIEKFPIWSLLISTVWVIILGILGSVIANEIST